MLYRFRRSLRKIRLRLNRELMLVNDLAEVPSISVGNYPPIRILKSTEVNMLNDVWPTDAERMRQRLAETSLCYITTENKKCLSYHWVQMRGKHFIQQLGIHAVLPERQAMIYHTRVAEAAKGKGINSYVLTQILNDLKQQGYRKVWIYTNAYNIANQKGLNACGFVEHARLTSIEYYHDNFLALTPFQFPAD